MGTPQDFGIGYTLLANMLVQGHVDTELDDCPQDKAQPLVGDLLHEVASNFAFPLALFAQSCDSVMPLSLSTALRSLILVHERH